MKTNKNLSNLRSYEVDVTDQKIKRSHANESQNPILPIHILSKDVFENISLYPERSYKDIECEASKFYNTKQEFIIPVNGSDEGLDLIIRTFCNPEDTIVILSPTFSMYRQYAQAFGLKIVEFDLNENFELKVDNFIASCQTQNPKIAFIPNPLAPTGGLISRANLIKIIENLPQTFIVVDEAYIEFSNQISLIDVISQYQNLIVTRTVSKFFGLAGIRLGFVFSKYKQEIVKIKSPYNVNQISCKIGINLFQNITKGLVERRFSENLNNKQKIIEWLGQFSEIKKIHLSHTNFLFLELNLKSETFARKLLNEYDIKIKAFAEKFDKFSRISF